MRRSSPHPVWRKRSACSRPPTDIRPTRPRQRNAERARTSARTYPMPLTSAGILHRPRNTPSTIQSETSMGDRPATTSFVGASAAPSQTPAVRPDQTPTMWRSRTRRGSTAGSLTEATAIQRTHCSTRRPMPSAMSGIHSCGSRSIARTSARYRDWGVISDCFEGCLGTPERRW